MAESPRVAGGETFKYNLVYTTILYLSVIEKLVNLRFLIPVYV